MARIEVELGEARVVLAGDEAATVGRGAFAHYSPRDLMDATAAALLAVNTPQSVAWAHAVYALTAEA